MTRYAKGHKERTHRRLVEAAAALLRERGLDGPSIPKLMAALDLTPGGFYAHFASKEALLAEAIAFALDQNASRLLELAQDAAEKGEPPLSAVVTGYLSEHHLKNPALGCTFVAVGPDLARGPEAPRAVATARLKNLVERLDGLIAGQNRPGRPESVLPVIASLVGAMILARLITDEDYAARLLASTQDFLLRALGGMNGDAPAPTNAGH